MGKALALLIAVCLPIKLLAAPPAIETRLTLKVTSVHDGDTFTGVNDANERLDAGAAPERSRSYRRIYRKVLGKVFFGTSFTVTTKKHRVCFRADSFTAKPGDAVNGSGSV
jgi:hypothetical protein